jgi:hypothetical protein
MISAPVVLAGAAVGTGLALIAVGWRRPAPDLQLPSPHAAPTLDSSESLVQVAFPQVTASCDVISDRRGEERIREEVLAATAAYTDATGAPTGYELWWSANIRRASIHRVARTRPGRLDWRRFPATAAEARNGRGRVRQPDEFAPLGSAPADANGQLISGRGKVAVGDQVMPSARGRKFTDLPMSGRA